MNDEEIPRLVVYTCVTNNYDLLRAPKFVETNVDYICFTDSKVGDASGWQIRALPKLTGSPAADNRYAKMHPHELFPDYQYSVYVDGDVDLVAPIRSLVLSALQKVPIAMYQHFSRNCLYEEGRVCAAIGYDWWWKIYWQLKSYRRNGFPHCFGMFEATVLIRNHNDPKLIRAMEAWWKLYIGGVKRDQLSLSYILWRLEQPVVNLGVADYRFNKRYFSLGFHLKRPSVLVRIRGKLNRYIDRLLGFFWQKDLWL